MLIDEPEAFVRPPPARQLGRILVKDKPEDQQLWLSTHSGDLVRGLLEIPDASVRVLRLRRRDDVNVVAELSSSDVKTLWDDPLLRYSNILDGLFHEA